MIRSKTAQYLDITERSMTKATQAGLMQLSTDSKPHRGRTLPLGGKELINFGSCSYLGLEQHPVMKAAVIEGVNQYGTQFSASRGFVSIPLYEELESLLEEIHGAPVVVSPTTTLGHLSALPLLIMEGDAVILDYQVHASVSMAAQMLRGRGIPCELIRHNDMEHLAQKIEQLQGKHRNIWYMADGIYSMYGDAAPLSKLKELLLTYGNLHLYIDDAHGISWTGPKGSGSVSSVLLPHPRVILAGSLNKSFAAAGGFIVLPDNTWKQTMRSAGSTLLFSGPIQPPLLSAAVASAKIHLGEGLPSLQQQLKQKIAFFNRMCLEHGLPLANHDISPIRFVPIGDTDKAYAIVKALMERGFYINLAVYPAVPLKKAGLRIAINQHLSLKNLLDLILAVRQISEMLTPNPAVSQTKAAQPLP